MTNSYMKKMLNFTNYQENENEKHYEMSSHTCQVSYYSLSHPPPKKNKRKQVLARIKKLKFLYLLVGMQNSVSFCETVLEFPKKITN